MATRQSTNRDSAAVELSLFGNNPSSEENSSLAFLKEHVDFSPAAPPACDVEGLDWTAVKFVAVVKNRWPQPASHKDFHEYCERNFKDEQFDFLSVADWFMTVLRKEAKNDVPNIVFINEAQKAITLVFIEQNAPKEINVSARLRDDVLGSTESLRNLYVTTLQQQSSLEPKASVSSQSVASPLFTTSSSSPSSLSSPLLGQTADNSADIKKELEKMLKLIKECNQEITQMFKPDFSTFSRQLLNNIPKTEQDSRALIGIVMTIIFVGAALSMAAFDGLSMYYRFIAFPFVFSGVSFISSAKEGV